MPPKVFYQTFGGILRVVGDFLLLWLHATI